MSWVANKRILYITVASSKFIKLEYNVPPDLSKDMPLLNCWVVWSVNCLVVWSVNYSVVWSVNCSVVWSVNFSVVWSVNYSVV